MCILSKDFPEYHLKTIENNCPRKICTMFFIHYSVSEVILFACREFLWYISALKTCEIRLTLLTKLKIAYQNGVRGSYHLRTQF